MCLSEKNGGTPLRTSRTPRRVPRAGGFRFGPRGGAQGVPNRPVAPPPREAAESLPAAEPMPVRRDRGVGARSPRSGSAPRRDPFPVARTRRPAFGSSDRDRMEPAAGFGSFRGAEAGLQPAGHRPRRRRSFRFVVPEARRTMKRDPAKTNAPASDRATPGEPSARDDAAPGSGEDSGASGGGGGGGGGCCGTTRCGCGLADPSSAIDAPIATDQPRRHDGGSA